MIRIQRAAAAAFALLVTSGAGVASAAAPALCAGAQSINLRTGQVVWSSWYGNQTNPVQTPTPDPGWVPNTAASWINDGRSDTTGLGSGGVLDDAVLAADSVLGPSVGVAPEYPQVPNPTASGVGIYRYSTSFWIDGATGILNFSYAGDNAVEFYLNNAYIGGYTPPGGANATLTAMKPAFNQWHALTAGGAVHGWNTLEARVNNYHGPTGVIVDGTATDCRGLSPAEPICLPSELATACVSVNLGNQ